MLHKLKEVHTFKGGAEKKEKKETYILHATTSLFHTQSSSQRHTHCYIMCLRNTESYSRTRRKSISLGHSIHKFPAQHKRTETQGKTQRVNHLFNTRRITWTMKGWYQLIPLITERFSYQHSIVNRSSLCFDKAIKAAIEYTAHFLRGVE